MTNLQRFGVPTLSQAPDPNHAWSLGSSATSTGDQPFWSAVRPAMWLLVLRPKGSFGTHPGFLRRGRSGRSVPVGPGGFGRLQFVDANEVEIAERGPRRAQGRQLLGERRRLGKG